ncbi:hypothetical protein DL93DRAFT_2155338 [Clavulina sp. PMI_390]|nr:hypothetical protein DL93DRAFT_2155338 [Clavulina sp. PMI_390]
MTSSDDGLSLHNPSTRGHKRNKDVSFFLLLSEIISEISLLALLPLGPLIWSSSVLASCIHISRKDRASERLECWLDRSGKGCPIHLTVEDVGLFATIEASWAAGGRIRDPRERIYSIIINSRRSTPGFPFPLQFDAVNLHELSVHFAPTDLPCPVRLFAHNPPAHLTTLKLENSIYQPERLDLGGTTLYELASLALAEEIRYDDVLILLAHTPKLTCLEWDLTISSYFPEIQRPKRVASLLRALPNLEYFDPGWRDTNIQGRLALCGESPTGKQKSLEWACPKIKRLHLPNRFHFDYGNLKSEALASCLRRVLNVRSMPPKRPTGSAELGNDETSFSGLAKPPRLTIVVDLDMATMSSIMGEQWSYWGGEINEILRFPSEPS